MWIHCTCHLLRKSTHDAKRQHTTPIVNPTSNVTSQSFSVTRSCNSSTADCLTTLRWILHRPYIRQYFTVMGELLRIRQPTFWGSENCFKACCVALGEGDERGLSGTKPAQRVEAARLHPVEHLKHKRSPAEFGFESGVFSILRGYVCKARWEMCLSFEYSIRIDPSILLA